MRPLCLVTNGMLRSHEVSVFRQYRERANKSSVNKRVKRVSIYDKAMNNYKWWIDQALQQHYMISLPNPWLLGQLLFLTTMSQMRYAPRM